MILGFWDESSSSEMEENECYPYFFGDSFDLILYYSVVL